MEKNPEMNYKEISNCKSLLDVLSCPKGYVFDCGIGCTYSADQPTFSKLKHVLGVTVNMQRLKDFEQGETFRLYVQQGESDIVHNAVKAVAPSEGVLHAKVYAMKYIAVDTRGPLYRVVVTSGNLTNSNELNICAKFDSEKPLPGVVKATFGADVSTFFKTHFPSSQNSSRIESLLKEIYCTRFGTDAEFLDVQSAGLLQKAGRMIQDAGSAKAITIFSPFLSDGFFERLKKAQNLPKQPECTLISRPDQMDACSAALGQFTCCTLGSPEKLDDDSMDLCSVLHAKIYLFYHESENEKYTVTYVGSANATESAFQKNIEVLVRFEDAGNKCVSPSEDGLYCEYEPKDPKDPDEALARFHAACHKLVASFHADEKQYSVKYPYYIIRLPKEEKGQWVHLNVALDNDCKPKCQNGHLVWERTNQYPHSVKLKIWDAQGHEEEFLLLVDGVNQNGEPVALPVQETALRWTVQQTIIKKLFGSKQITSGGEGRTQSNSDPKETGKRKKGLVERLSGLDDEKEIREVYGKSAALLSSLSGSDPIKPILEAFNKACRDQIFSDTSCPPEHEKNASQDEQKGEDGNE